MSSVYVPVRVGKRLVDLGEVVELQDDDGNVVVAFMDDHMLYVPLEEVGEFYAGSKEDAFNYFDKTSNWSVV